MFQSHVTHMPLQKYWSEHSETQTVSSRRCVCSVLFHYIRTRICTSQHFAHSSPTSYSRSAGTKCTLKTALDEIWSVLIMSGSTAGVILLAAADDVWGKPHLTKSQHPELQGDLVSSGCCLPSRLVMIYFRIMGCILSASIMLSVLYFRELNYLQQFKDLLFFYLYFPTTLSLLRA